MSTAYPNAIDDFGTIGWDTKQGSPVRGRTHSQMHNDANAAIVALETALGTSTNPRLPFNVLNYGVVADGVTDNIAAFQALLAIVSAAGGGTIYAPRGTYWFNITGDSSCLMVPSNTTIYGDPGTVFKWSYWGSPLIGIIEVQNVTISDIEFEWGGTFGTTTGSRTFKTYSRALPSYQYCCHIANNGSDNVTLRNLRMYGTTTSNNQNQGIQIAGHDDGTTQSQGLVIDNLVLDDLCQGIGIEGQTGFKISNLFSNRHSQASVGLYGPGHVMYMLVGTPCSNGIVSGVFDVGVSNDSDSMSGHTLSCKYLNNVIVSDVASSRPAGPINWTQCTGVLFKSIKFTTGSSLYDTSAHAIQYTGQGGSSRDVAFRDISLYWTLDSSVNQPPFGIAVDANPPTNVTVSGLVIRRYMTGAEVGSIVFGAINSSLEATIIHDGSGSPRTLITTRPTTAGNLFNIKSTGSNPSAVVDTSAFGTGSNNRYNIRIDTSDVWINQNEVSGLVSDLASINSTLSSVPSTYLPIASPVATSKVVCSGTAPRWYLNETDGTFDMCWFLDGGTLFLKKMTSDATGNGTALATVQQIDSAGAQVYGATSGGTYNGNIRLSTSDHFPGLTLRSATTIMAQFLADAQLGDFFADVTAGRTFYIRDTIGGGGGSISTWKLTGSVVLSPLKVTSATTAAAPGSNEVTFGGGIANAKTSFKVDNVQVIGAQQTGMGATLGAKTLSGIYATDLADIQALYDKMVALETKLKTHGLVAT